MRFLMLLCITLLLWPSMAMSAGSYGYGDGREVVGFVRSYTIVGKETFHDIALEYFIGYDELVEANRGVDPWVPPVGQRVLLPSQWIVPDVGFDRGVVVNLAEKRLYRFFISGNRKLVSSYPIGVGAEGYHTPTGQYSVSDKLVMPSWFVPESAKQENPSLPDVVPPGEDNPLGDYALRLSDSRFFIHGTNKPLGIGMRVSHGCIRLYPEDIAELFSIVNYGERVDVVYKPVKAGVRSGRIYLEVHRDYLGLVDDMGRLVRQELESKGLDAMVDPALVLEAINNHSGVPFIVGSLDEKKSPKAVTKGDLNNLKQM